LKNLIFVFESERFETNIKNQKVKRKIEEALRASNLIDFYH
jgi:hypothetical protein